jgi:hypothetical protein
MNNEVVLLAGLPGSGTTTYLCQMCRDGWLVFDDFKALAFEDCSKVRSSLKLSALLAAIQDGLRCAVADIDFCDTDARNEAENILRTEISGVDVRWEFFANDPSACEANIRARNRSGLGRQLDCLAKSSHSYNIPEGAVVLPVWQKL